MEPPDHDHPDTLLFAGSSAPKRYAKWRERRKILNWWRTIAGQVSAEVEVRRDFMVPLDRWSPEVLAKRRELAKAMAGVSNHVAICRGDGIRCACRLLSLGLSAFRTRTLDIRRRNAARLQRFALYVVTALGLVLWFREALFEAARHFRTGTDIGAFTGAALAGIAAGLIVAGVQSAMAAIGQVAEYSGEQSTRVGHHPDGAWIFLSGFIPGWRGKVRRNRLRRDLAAWEELVQGSLDRPGAPDPEIPARVNRERPLRCVAIAVAAVGGTAVAFSLARRLIVPPRRFEGASVPDRAVRSGADGRHHQ